MIGVTASEARSGGRWRWRFQLSAEDENKLVAVLFATPLIAVSGVVIIGPAAASLFYACTEWSGLGSARFVGLANFRALLSDPEYLSALVHNLLWMAFFVSVPVLLGLLGAFLLSRVRRFQLLFRLVYFIPYVVATVVNSAIWEDLLDPSRGVGASMASVGFSFLAGVNVLGNPHLALWGVALANGWQYWGFLLVIFLVAMQTVDPALYEAARVDGASVWQEFRHVTLPGIRPTLTFMLLMTVIWSMLVFDYVYIMTQGGPAGATDVVSTVAYRDAFGNREAGYAAAMGVTMTAITGGVVAGYLFLRRRGWEI